MSFSSVRKAFEVLQLKVDHKLVGEGLSINVEKLRSMCGMERGSNTLVHCLDELGLVGEM